MRREVIDLLEGPQSTPLMGKEARIMSGSSAVIRTIRSAIRKLGSTTIDPMAQQGIRSRLVEALDLVKRGEVGEARLTAEEAVSWLDAAW